MFYRYKIQQAFKKLATKEFFQKAFHFTDNSVGSILMLHRVGRMDPKRFGVNEHLKVSPEFLDKLIVQSKGKGFTFVSMEEMYGVLRLKKNTQKLIAVTLDDGYQDNLTNGLPVFKKHSVPFIVYVATALPEKNFIYWWYLLEDFIAQNDLIVLGDGTKYICKTKKNKERVFMAIREKIMAIHPQKLETALPELLGRQIDVYKYNDTLPLSWEQVKQLKNEPLATIGSHTHSHMQLNFFSEQEIMADIGKANNLFREKAGFVPEHFCYPYGGKDLAQKAEVVSSMKFKTAVTTNPGNIYLRHADELFLLPRFFVTEQANPDIFSTMTWFKYWNK